MDSELEERKLSSIRRPQILFIYRKGGVGNPETFGQIACSVWRLPIRFMVGTGGTISGGTIRKDSAFFTLRLMQCGQVFDILDNQGCSQI